MYFHDMGSSDDDKVRMAPTLVMKVEDGGLNMVVVCCQLQLFMETGHIELIDAKRVAASTTSI